jgi:hypothetical protein
LGLVVGSVSEPTIDSPTDAPPFVIENTGPITPDHTANGDVTPPDAPVGPQPGESPQSWRERVTRKRDAAKREREARNVKPPKAEKPLPPKPRKGELAKPLTETYVGIGVLISPFDPACGMAVMTNAQACAESLEELARVNPAVRRALVALTQTGAWGGVIAAHLPLLAVIAVHHAPKDIAEMVRPLAVSLNDRDAKESTPPVDLSTLGKDDESAA